MSRLVVLITLMLTCVALTGSQVCDGGQPNVLLICVDDLKPAIGCYGDPVAVTPNIDALAARGVRFDMAFCNQAVCSPSRNSLMTGLRPQTIGIYDLDTHFRKAAPDATTIGQHFIQQGYRAEGLGKILHTGHGNQDDQRSWSVPSWRPKAPGYVNEASLSAVRETKDGRMRGPATESADVSDETYADGMIALEAARRLEAFKQNPDQPFFLAVGFLKPHLPFVAPKRFWDLYDPSKLPMPQVTSEPVGAPEYAKTNGGELRNYTGMPSSGAIDESTTRQLIHGYYAATSYTDAQIGKVLDALKQLELDGNTIVILWGDHGWHLGDHGMWCKHTNYEQATRIPIIVSAPDGARSKASSSLIETVDVFPTVCELSGLSVPAGLDGQSFAAVVRDPSQQVRSFVTHVYPRGERLGRAIRTDQYRMVEWKVPGEPDSAAEIELYDYANDPLETKNIADQEPNIVGELRELLAAQGEAKPQWKAPKEKRRGS